LNDKKRPALAKSRTAGENVTGFIQVVMITATNHLKTQTESSRVQAEPVDIWRARNFICQNFTDQLSLTSVARVANISAGHLSEKFRQVTGVNFVDYVGNVRIERACDLLSDEKMRISEIAFAVGFQSLSQFNRVFKKVHGRSPTEYRAGLRQQKFLEA
jgi:AraC-like DNA-binding protein